MNLTKYSCDFVIGYRLREKRTARNAELCLQASQTPEVEPGSSGGTRWSLCLATGDTIREIALSVGSCHKGKKKNKTGVGTEPRKDTENFFSEVACGMLAREDVTRYDKGVIKGVIRRPQLIIHPKLAGVKGNCDILSFTYDRYIDLSGPGIKRMLFRIRSFAVHQELVCALRSSLKPAFHTSGNLFEQNDLHRK
ncbi:hypothetical protein MJG53_019408 [Ovis ammon polii x Ovis aries]|uniref:Uncharacterized protein n=1 Tax=Ovis ammon polii x Ovis aries TaxID=2918886 RepID=A0ACB9U095_9CETA|nr:hypothetical protein MJG53_019408 [Ovis ammon polii x Ovis aries]